MRDERAERAREIARRGERATTFPCAEMARPMLLLLLLAAVSLASSLRLHGGCGVPTLRPARTRIELLAKKKKGGKAKGKKQQQSGFAWASNFELKPTESAALRELAELTVTTYRTRTGKTLHTSLDKSGVDVPKALWSAPLCVMVLRASEDGSGSVVTYANPAAVEAHGLNVGDGYKSLIEAPTPLVATLNSGKYDSGYDKKLATAAGDAKFTVRDAERWALEKMAVVDGKLANEPIGLAIAWERWELEDGTTCLPGGERIAPTMDPADVQAAIDAQAARVRSLKEEDGLTNEDAEVKDAVSELLRLKALLTPDE